MISWSCTNAQTHRRSDKIKDGDTVTWPSEKVHELWKVRCPAVLVNEYQTHPEPTHHSGLWPGLQDRSSYDFLLCLGRKQETIEPCLRAMSACRCSSNLETATVTCLA